MLLNDVASTLIGVGLTLESNYRVPCFSTPHREGFDFIISSPKWPQTKYTLQIRPSAHPNAVVRLNRGTECVYSTNDIWNLSIYQMITVAIHNIRA